MFDIQAAKQAGYSDQEIENFLTQNHPNFDVHAAIKAGYSLPEIAGELNNPAQQDPGLLKSAAAGVMSGVPGAEAATAGIESALENKPYVEEHQTLENLKNQAWG